MSYEVIARVIERLEALADATDSRADHELLTEELDLLQGIELLIADGKLEVAKPDVVEEKIRTNVEAEFVQPPPEEADE